jgi:hypothetical protein
MSLSVEGNVGRALLVACLAFIAYALVRYWQSLEGQSRERRFYLVGLRGAALLLLACAVAGLSVEYQKRAGSRVLVSLARGVHLNRGEDRRVAEDEAALWKTITTLRENGIEAEEDTVANDALRSGQDAAFNAAVLLTDGALSATEALEEVERMKVRVGGAPVFVVTDLRQAVVPGVVLESVSLPVRPARGVPLLLRCTVRARGMRGRETLVTISDDAKVQASAMARWVSDDERQTLTLEVVPKVAGWSDYVVRVEGAGGEAVTALMRNITVYVEERRTRILFFEGEPTWEAKFIRRALEQTGIFEVDYFAQVSRSAAAGATQAEEQNGNVEGGAQTKPSAGRSAERGGTPEARLHAELASAERLSAYDSIIIGATPDEMLTGAESVRLQEWVERRGGGLIVLGGNSFAGSLVAPAGKLYRLLPTEIDARSFKSDLQAVARGGPLEAEATQKGIALVPTEAGANAALRGYTKALEEERTNRVGILTGEGLRLGVLRPGASLLAVADKTGAGGTSEGGTPLIAGAQHGAGRTLVFAPADSWRMRTSASGEQDALGGTFGALWQGLVLWTAAGARSASEIVFSDELPAEGGELAIEVRVRDAAYALSKIEKLSARLQPLTEDAEGASSNFAQAREIVFTPSRSEPNVWRARTLQLKRGRYALEVDYQAEGKSVTLEKRFAVTAPTTLEEGAARDAFERLARETGGSLLALADLNTLVKQLNIASPYAEQIKHTWKLHTFWPLAFIIPLLLSAEWFLRRLWQIEK